MRRSPRKATLTGNPVRPAVIAAAATPYPALDDGGPIRLLVFGGSQGARVMSDIVPAGDRAARRRELRARLRVVQQARAEDVTRVRDAYARLGVEAEVAPFFTDLPARIAAAHLVVSRSGASTVAELAVIGRPAILVPLPHALDQDQLANANVLAQAGGAIVLAAGRFHARALADEIAGACWPIRRGSPRMAAAAKSAGVLDAADRLADLVLREANVVPRCADGLEPDSRELRSP